MTFEFEGRPIAAEEGESVLDALLRAGESVDHGCKAGACQSCLLRSAEGTAPSDSTKTLDESIAALGGFLSCRAKAGSVPRVERLDPGSVPTHAARIGAIERLTSEILRIVLETEIAARPGQFIRCVSPQGVSRCYSVARSESGSLELHVRLIPSGQMSDLLSRAKEGDGFALQGPFGRCYYRTEHRNRPMLLIASSTGLAPLYGVMREALARGHVGRIALYHGAATSDGLYLREELEGLSGSHANLSYVACADQPTRPGDRLGSPLDLALQDLGDLEGYVVYLCGHPAMVRAGQKRCFLAGADLQDLFTDPFENQIAAP